MEENLHMTATILSRRTLKRPTHYRNKNFNADTHFQTWISDSKYVVFTHMTRESFLYVLDMIQSHPVFVNPSILSPSQQRSVHFQLFVALSRLASDGDGWCMDRISEVFQIGHGSVTNYTERVCEALNKHARKWISWPTAAARRALSALGDEKYGFPGFVASCDGTLIALRRAPAFDMFPETYHHHRHGGYGFNVLFWVDHHGSIIRVMCNWPASASDQAIFDASTFAQQPYNYLKKNEEFIFTDLGFKREVFSVPPYKGAEARIEHNALFNHAQRVGRVKVFVNALLFCIVVTETQVEHANGVIKARFASLKSIPIDIRSADDMPRCSSWITACVILHNILISLRDQFEYANESSSSDDEGNVDFANQPTPAAKVFQNAVRDRWLRDVQGWE